MTRPQPEQERERAQSDAEKDAGDGRDWLQHLPIAILVLTTLIMVGAYFFGERLLGISGQDGVAGVFEGFRQSPLAPFVVVLVFTGLGLTGFPQFLLIAGTVAIFGPVAGFFYSWTATMVSSGVGFFLGHLSGARLLRRWGGQTVNRASEIIGRHGILATIIVRLVPSGPFVMVNLVSPACPTSPMPNSPWAPGSALFPRPRSSPLLAASSWISCASKTPGSWPSLYWS